MVDRIRLTRAWRHLVFADVRIRRAFPAATLDRIEAAVRESERKHHAEVRFVVEGALDVLPVWRGLTPRDRAIELFSVLRVWDTAHNNGVLIYVQLVDHDIEIVADRGLNTRVTHDEWEAVCRNMETAFRAGAYEAGALDGIAAATAILTRHYPAVSDDADELPNRPLLL